MGSGLILINALFPACLLRRQAGLVVGPAGLWAGRARFLAGVTPNLVF